MSLFNRLVHTVCLNNTCAYRHPPPPPPLIDGPACILPHSGKGIRHTVTT